MTSIKTIIGASIGVALAATLAVPAQAAGDRWNQVVCRDQGTAPGDDYGTMVFYYRATDDNVVIGVLFPEGIESEGSTGRKLVNDPEQIVFYGRDHIWALSKASGVLALIKAPPVVGPPVPAIQAAIDASNNGGEPAVLAQCEQGQLRMTR